MEKNSSTLKTKSLTSFFSNKYVIVLGFILVAILRFYYCCQTTINTGDTLRHISWGLVINKHGYSAINQNLIAFYPQLKFVAWNHLPFNYPILALVFDQIVTYIYPSLFCIKFALTIIEFFNTLLVKKLTNNWLLSFAYWASPISIWWVSHEGQFEPLQNIFIFLVLLFFANNSRKNLAYLILGLGIQVKLTAMFLLPYFLLKEEKEIKTLIKRGLFFLLAFIPTLSLFFITNPFQLILQSLALRFNPYFFNFFDKDMSLWLPNWMIFSNQITTYGLLAILIAYRFPKPERLVEIITPLIFLVFLKTVSQAQPWYLITLYPFLLTLDNLKLRNSLWLGCFLLDIFSIGQIIFGPFGYTVPNYYKALNNDAFMRLDSLF